MIFYLVSRPAESESTLLTDKRKYWYKGWNATLIPAVSAVRFPG